MLRSSILAASILLIAQACGGESSENPAPGGSGSGAGGSGTGATAGAAGEGAAAGVAGMDGDGDGCIRDYDLATYTGETMGLCPAAEVNHCDCGDVGAADLLVCAPDGSACTVQHGVCAGGNVPDCGWHECAWPSEQPQTDELCQDLVASIEAAAADTEHDRRCVRDDDCTLPGRCVRRVHNLMFCADPPE